MEYPFPESSQRTYTLAVPEKEVIIVEEEKPKKTKRSMNLWLALVILFIIVLIILYFVHPSFVLSQNPQTNELYLDWAKVILWSLGIAIIIVLLIYVLKGVAGYETTY